MNVSPLYCPPGLCFLNRLKTHQVPFPQQKANIMTKKMEAVDYGILFRSAFSSKLSDIQSPKTLKVSSIWQQEERCLKSDSLLISQSSKYLAVLMKRKKTRDV
jgi:hypothetical protein